MRYIYFIVIAILVALLVSYFPQALAQTSRIFTSGQVGLNPINGYCLTTDGANSTWLPCSSGSSKWTDNGATLTPLNNESIIVNGTSTLQNLVTNNIQASTSAGFDFHTQSGSQIANLGAGGGTNATFYGGVNIDGQTRIATSITGLVKAASGVLSAAISGTDYVATTSGDWLGTFDGQEGSFYLSRANHTGTQLASTISDFVSTVRTSISETVTGLDYTSGTGVLSLTSGYSIPLTASTTDWQSFYTTPSTRITAGTGLSWSGNTLNATGGGSNWTIVPGGLRTSTSTDFVQAASFNATSTTETSTFAGGITMQGWALSTSTVVCMAPEKCQFQADGVADDVTIQAAINAMALSGGKVFIKHGTYDISASMTLYNNISIEGESHASILQSSTEIFAEAGAFTESNITIRNLGVDLEDSTNNGRLIDFASGTHENIFIEGNYIYSAAEDAVVLVSGNNIHIKNNVIYNVLNGIAVGDSSFPNATVFITGNDIRNIDQTIASVTEYGEGIEVNMHNTVSATAVITNNYLEGFSEEGMDVNVENATVSNNIVVMNPSETRASNGISIGASGVSNNAVVTSNIIKNINDTGLLIYLTNNANVSNNTFIGTTSAATNGKGIRITATTNSVKITDNRFNDLYAGVVSTQSATATLNMASNVYTNVFVKNDVIRNRIDSFSLGSVDVNFESSLRFNGSSDYVTVPSGYLTTQATTSPITLFMRFRSDVGTYSSSDLNQFYTSQYTTIRFRDATVRCATNAGNASATLEADTWTTVACTYDGTQVQMYKNGIFTASTTAVATAKLRSGAIGKVGANTTDSRYFDGNIDDVMVFDRVLTDDEIYSLSVLGTTTASTSGYYKFDGESGAIAEDSSAYNIDGTITGAVFSSDTADSGKLVWQNGVLTLNSRLGIGTTTPEANLSIVTSGFYSPLHIQNLLGTTLFKVSTNGNVGIGSTTPAALLGVNGSGFFGGNLTATGTLAITGATTLTSLTVSGNTTFSGLTASRALFTDSSSRATTTGSSSALSASLSDETGTGSAVFSASPTLTGTVLASGLTLSGTLAVNRPSNHWSTSNHYLVGTAASPLGQLDTNGSFEVTLTSNGYRNNGATWTSYGANGNTGAAQIGLAPYGSIIFRTNTNKASGTATFPTQRMELTGDGNLGIGDSTPDNLLDISSSTGQSALAIYSGGADTDPVIKFELSDGTPTFTMGIDDSDSDKFKISGSALGTNDRFVIDASGNIGIGTSTPASLLTVAGEIWSTIATFLTTLVMPFGTACDSNADGEICHDTSDNQLIVGGAVVGKATQVIWSRTVASTSPAFIDAGLMPLPTRTDGFTITRIQCHVVGGTSKVIAIEDASGNSSEDITCATTNTTDDGSITNATFTASELAYIDFGATSGSVNYVNITVEGQWTRE